MDYERGSQKYLDKFLFYAKMYFSKIRFSKIYFSMHLFLRKEGLFYVHWPETGIKGFRRNL